MRKYLLIIRLCFLDLLEYRFDNILGTLKYSFMILMMGFVWLAVGEAGQLSYTPTETITYFFFAAMIFGLSNFHTVYIEEDIKLGFLSRFLLRPLNPYWYYCCLQAGKTGAETIMRFVGILPIMWLLHFSITFSWPGVLLFLLYLPWIYFCSFTLISLISTGTFWLNETYALRWAITIFFRFLSGVLVPLSFFPDWWQRISVWLPFQYLAYTPIQVLLNKVPFGQGLQSLAILIVWSLVLFALQQHFWRAGESVYEGTGI